MADDEQQKTLTLAEQWSLQDNDGKLDQSEIPIKETTETGKPADTTSVEVVPQNSDEIPVADEGTPIADEGTPVADEGTPIADEGTPVAEENNEAHEEVAVVQEDAEEKPEIKLETAPADFRFPTTNQTRHCFTRYIEYHRCIAAKGDGAPECDKFAKYYRSLCPSEWVERWNEQRENGTFPGPL